MIRKPGVVRLHSGELGEDDGGGIELVEAARDIDLGKNVSASLIACPNLFLGILLSGHCSAVDGIRRHPGFTEMLSENECLPPAHGREPVIIFRTERCLPVTDEIQYAHENTIPSRDRASQ